MSLSLKLLSAVVAMAVIGSARAASAPDASGATFADVFDFTVGTAYQTVLASAHGPTLADYDGDGPLEASGVLLPDGFPAHVDGMAGMNDGYRFSIAAVPEPPGGMLFLCGLAIMTFIARRRAGPAAA